MIAHNYTLFFAKVRTNPFPSGQCHLHLYQQSSRFDSRNFIVREEGRKDERKRERESLCVCVSVCVCVCVCVCE